MDLLPPPLLGRAQALVLAPRLVAHFLLELQVALEPAAIQFAAAQRLLNGAARFDVVGAVTVLENRGSNAIEKSAVSGLGLTIVQSVVNDHGGEVWIEPETHLGGAGFTIILPVSPLETSRHRADGDRTAIYT